jgi:hypothetical protein
VRIKAELVQSVAAARDLGAIRAAMRKASADCKAFSISDEFVARTAGGTIPFSGRGKGDANAGRRSDSPMTIPTSSREVVVEEEERTPPLLIGGVIGSPPELPEAALYGLPGKLACAWQGYAESSTGAILIHALVKLGVAIGRGPFFRVGPVRHRALDFAVVVGRTNEGRKGESEAASKEMIHNVAPPRASGLSSGEGLISAVRDRVTRRDEKGNEVVVDEGVDDKRLLVVESEFTRVLRQGEREGNILFETICQFWDSPDTTGSMTKDSGRARSRQVATAPHVGIIAHVTPESLVRTLSATEIASGFANRFMFVFVERREFLALPPAIPDDVVDDLHEEVREAIVWARSRGSVRVDFDEEAEATWREIYPELAKSRPGMRGALLSRGAPHVLRIALIHALLDQSAEIRLAHLRAAIALWEWSEASVFALFGERFGNPEADKIVEAVAPGERVSRTDIRRIMGGGVPAEKIEAAIRLLLQVRGWKQEKTETGGRPAEWLVRDPLPPEPEEESRA